MEMIEVDFEDWHKAEHTSLGFLLFPSSFSK